MALDRGTLAKIDRRVFAELGHHGATHTVKVPVSDAMWSVPAGGVGGMRIAGGIRDLGCTGSHPRAYIRPWTSDTQRTNAYHGFIHFYNHHRSHGALGWATPTSTLKDNLPAQHT